MDVNGSSPQIKMGFFNPYTSRNRTKDEYVPPRGNTAQGLDIRNYGARQSGQNQKKDVPSNLERPASRVAFAPRLNLSGIPNSKPRDTTEALPTSRYHHSSQQEEKITHQTLPIQNAPEEPKTIESSQIQKPAKKLGLLGTFGNILGRLSHRGVSASKQTSSTTSLGKDAQPDTTRTAAAPENPSTSQPTPKVDFTGKFTSELLFKKISANLQATQQMQSAATARNTKDSSHIVWTQRVRTSQDSREGSLGRIGELQPDMSREEIQKRLDKSLGRSSSRGPLSQRSTKDLLGLVSPRADTVQSSYYMKALKYHLSVKNKTPVGEKHTPHLPPS